MAEHYHFAFLRFSSVIKKLFFTLYKCYIIIIVIIIIIIIIIIIFSIVDIINKRL